MKQLLILADDFSGACEIAGIISRYGHSAEIQLSPDPRSRADALVLDLDTRQPDAAAMEAKMAEIIPFLTSHAHLFTIFKKVDSVFRGHILKETAFLLEALRLHRVFLLPANPSTGRKIIDGSYFVDGNKLHTTTFGSDPHFPKTSSRIDTIIDYHDFPLQHTHLDRSMPIPAKGLLTADIASMADLEYYTSFSDDTTLYCGGAQCFDAYVRNILRWNRLPQQRTILPQLRTFFINGSTVRTDSERTIIADGSVASIPLPGEILIGCKQFDSATFDKWIDTVLDAYRASVWIYFYFDLPVIAEKCFSDALLKHLVHLVNRLQYKTKGERLHLLLCGGATADAIINDSGETMLQVVTEHAQGVVTVASGKYANRLYTVKPGSYPWPRSLFRRKFES